MPTPEETPSEPPGTVGGGVGSAAALIGEDILRMLMLRVALAVAAVVAVVGVAGEELPAALRVADVGAGIGAFLTAAVAGMQPASTRARQWTIILGMLLVCGGLLATSLVRWHAG